MSIPRRPPQCGHDDWPDCGCVVEPAESDPGFGWLRTYLPQVNPAGLFVWPRAGHEMACGRHVCAVCGKRG